MATSWSPSTTIHQQKIAEHKKATAAASSSSSSSAATSIKTVYFTVGERKEVAVFEDAAPVDEIKSLFCSAAEAGPRDILKMYTPQGALINITNKLASNGPDAPYRLELVAAHHDEGWERVGEGLVRLEQRVTELEQRMRDHQQNQQMVQSQPTTVVRDLREQLDQLKRDLNSCGRTRYGQQGGLGRPYWNRTKGRRKSDEEKRLVCDKYLHISRMTLTEEIRRCLRMPTFDNWQWEDEEILLLLQQMYVDLNLCSKFAIDLDVLRKFLCQVYMNYNEVPFHNFQHCFTVSQMMYGIIWCLDLPAKIGDLETLILLTSCICHDLDHPGFNNIYQINAGTELALRYNDISPLENHHCSVAFNILEDTTANIFRSFAPDVYKVVREGIIRCILATDMARHNEILGQFNQIVPVFDYDNRAHINLLCMVLIKVSDISNEARPMDVAEPWLDCLLTEFYEQSDLEKKEGLPVTPFMDPEKISRPSSQCSFIGFVLLPLFESIAKLYPQLEGLIVQPVRDALDYYRKLNDASKESSSSSRQRSVDLLLPADSNSPATATSTPGEDSNKTILAVADDIVDKSNASFKDDNLAVIGSNSNSLDRSLSQEEIRRFSFGLEADERSFTEVEVCEKTFTFKISTDIRPAIGPNYWNNKSGEQAAAAALRRASFNALASPADILGRKIPRSANTSPVSSVTTRPSWNIAEEAEQKVPKTPPRLVPALTINGLKDPPSETASGSSPSSSPSSPSLPTQVAANPKETEIIQQQPEHYSETSCSNNSSSATAVRPRSPAPTRENAFLSRLKHWTDRLNPLGASTDSRSTAAEESPASPPVTPSSPAKSRRVLSRFFARSRSASSSPQLSRKSTASLDTVPT